MRDSSTITETYCTECGKTVGAKTPHCPTCGTEDPWDERPTYQFNSDNLPFVFSMEVYYDHYELWDAFCRAYWGVSNLKGSEVADVPRGFPKMKYCVFSVHFAVTESCGLEGPFLREREANEAVDQ